ncbi:ABC transporter permease [Acuticoccus sp. MNP-M23]|uniref:ABC transporter permease n=1 Tax=Acuticoccus sp. MNP-M23 TaxID=3072793 RepID=UPI0035BF6EB8
MLPLSRTEAPLVIPEAEHTALEDPDFEADLLDTGAATATTRAGMETQWQLVWRAFRAHKLAMISLVLIVLLYLVAAFAEFLAPNDPQKVNPRYTYAPPQMIHLFEDDWTFRPHVHGYKVEVDPVALRRTFVVDPDTTYNLVLFPKSWETQMWGLFPIEHHLFGVDGGRRATLFLLGTDRLGRDLLSRMIYGARITLSIGLAGIALSLVFGVLIGGVSGYYGGVIDNVIQRVIEFIRSIPPIPLWMGFAAALPRDWSAMQNYFAITLILSLIGWTELARVVRSRFLSLKSEDYVSAARLDGAKDLRIIMRHMLPSFTSHVIAVATLAIPGMILAETSLSFLGLGLQSPVISWGVLLQEAQNLRAVADAPWLLLPGFAIVVTILAMNFLGDGMRDAADPYGGH